MRDNIRPTAAPAELHPLFPAIHADLIGLNWEDDGDTLAAAIGGYQLAILRPDPHLLNVLPGDWPPWNATIEAEVAATRWDTTEAVVIRTLGPFHWPEDALANVILAAAALLVDAALVEADIEAMHRLADEARDLDESAGVYDLQHGTATEPVTVIWDREWR